MHELAGRIQPLGYDSIDADAKELWDDVADGRRGVNVPKAPGSLGPYNALLYSPKVGRHFAALGYSTRFDTSLPPRLRELATIVVGAAYRAEFEWAMHSRWARKAGVSDATIAAIARDVTPDLDDPDDLAVYNFTRSLIQSGRVPDDQYREVIERFGEAQVVDLTVIVSFYVAISLLMNTFEVPLPPGLTPTWATVPDGEAPGTSDRK
jgi:4-carboxymuconolactone decarboxylase